MSTPAVSDNNAAYFQALVPGTGLNQFLDFTNAAAYTQAFDPKSTIVELFSTQDCWVRFVASADVTTVASVPAGGSKQDCKFIPGGITAFLGIPRDGTTYKISVIRDTASGRLHLTEGK